MKKNKIKLAISITAIAIGLALPKVDALTISESLSTMTPSTMKQSGYTIRYYEQFSNQQNARNYILDEYHDELTFLANIYGMEKIDIDNTQFQEFLMADLEFDGLSRKRLGELTGLIDIYENSKKNNEIENLKNELSISTLNASTLNNKNEIINELEMIMPMEDVNDNVFEVMSKYSNGYDPNKAIQYAHKWANSYNTTTYNKLKSDCANFVSQCLFEGGMKAYYKAHWPIVGNIIQEDTKNWYFYDENGKKAPSYTWTGASEFFSHWWNKRRATKTNTLSLFAVGDPVGCDWKGDGDINHMVIIDGKTGSTSTTITYSGHTSARMNEPIKSLFDYKAGTKIYALKVANAVN